MQSNAARPVILFLIWPWWNPSVFEGTNLPYRIVAAMELNDVANEVYRHNFPNDNLMQKNIEVFHLSIANMALFSNIFGHTEWRVF